MYSSSGPRSRLEFQRKRMLPRGGAERPAFHSIGGAATLVNGLQKNTGNLLAASNTVLGASIILTVSRLEFLPITRAPWYYNILTHRANFSMCVMRNNSGSAVGRDGEKKMHKCPCLGTYVGASMDLHGDQQPSELLHKTYSLPPFPWLGL